MSEATRRPWKAKKRNWRNEPTEHDWHISGNICEPIDPDSDDPDENTGSATAVAIVVGNATAGDIPEADARLIVKAVNREYLFGELVARLQANQQWLASYPGGGADAAYESTRALLESVAATEDA